MRINSFDLLFIVGLIVWLVLFLSYVYKNGGRSKCTVEVVATVVSIAEKQGRVRTGYVTMYQPVFEYKWKGFTRRLETEIWSSYHKYEIGDKVKLLIDPDDPRNYRYKNSLNDPITMMGIGFFVILAVTVISILSKQIGM